MRYRVTYKNNKGQSWCHELESSYVDLALARQRFANECKARGLELVDCVPVKDDHPVEFYAIPKRHPSQSTALLMNLKREQDRSSELRARVAELDAQLAEVLAGRDNALQSLQVANRNNLCLSANLRASRDLLARLIDWFSGSGDDAVDMAVWLDSGTAIFNEARARLVKGVE